MELNPRNQLIPKLPSFQELSKNPVLVLTFCAKPNPLLTMTTEPPLEKETRKNRNKRKKGLGVLGFFFSHEMVTEQPKMLQ